MARKPDLTPADTPLTASQIKQNIERLQRRIAELEKFDPVTVKERWAPETNALAAAIDDTLSRIFGHNTSRYNRYRSAAKLDHGAVIMGGDPDPLYKVHRWLEEGKADSLALLREALKSL